MSPINDITIVVLVQLQQFNMHECGCVRTRGCICARARTRLMPFTCTVFFRHLFSVQSNANYGPALATNGGGRAKLSYKRHLLTLNSSSVRGSTVAAVFATLKQCKRARATRAALLTWPQPNALHVCLWDGPDNSGHNKSVLADPKMTSISYLIRNDFRVFWCSVVVVKIDWLQ